MARRWAGTVLTMAGAAALMTAGGCAPGASAGSGSVADVYSAMAPAAHAVPSPAAEARLQASAHAGHGHAWRIGFAKESVDPSQAQIDTRQLHLGGYGIAPTRASTGPLVDGDGTVEHIYARAMAITNRSGQSLLLAALENQGTFAAYKQGPYGLYDIRLQVSKDTGVPVDSIVIDSDHSHAGPDLIGLWGGVPVSYLQLVHDQTVKALDQAFANRRPADLLVGTDTPVVPGPAIGHYVAGSATPGEFFDHSQFGPDTATGYGDDQVDTQLRVLQAYDEDGNPLGTLINYAAHGTVMGGGNVRYSADWPGRVARATELALAEPVAVTMVADVGRTQPPRPFSNPNCGQAGQEPCDVDQLDTWTRLFTPWVVQAVTAAVPVRGDQVASNEVMTREVGTNGALVGASYSGEVPVRGYGAYRSVTPPWFSGGVIGTFASAHRVGDILLTANPGEAYPDIRFGVLRGLSEVQAGFTFGLANDQLGYLIAPASEYGWIAASQPGNDNALFNVSAQYGDHLYCTQLAESVALGFAATGAPAYQGDAAQPVCPVESAGDAVPVGPAPQQPWPFGDGVALPSPFPQ